MKVRRPERTFHAKLVGSRLMPATTKLFWLMWVLNRGNKVCTMDTRRHLY